MIETPVDVGDFVQQGQVIARLEDRDAKLVRLVGVTPKGELYTLAGHTARSEFAGVTFTPDGTTLLVNIQHRAYNDSLGNTNHGALIKISGFKVKSHELGFDDDGN